MMRMLVSPRRLRMKQQAPASMSATPRGTLMVPASSLLAVVPMRKIAGAMRMMLMRMMMVASPPPPDQDLRSVMSTAVPLWPTGVAVMSGVDIEGS